MCRRLVAWSVLALGMCQVGWSQEGTPAPKAPASPGEVLAELYEHLAASIIEIRATEDSLVKGLLIHYHASAQRRLAQAAEGQDRVAHLEAAATDVANIAYEGDKRVRAVRQRLVEAGHYHQEDVETKDDYMYINSKEKKSFLAMAERIGKLRAQANESDIRSAAEELKSLFGKAIGRE